MSLTFFRRSASTPARRPRTSRQSFALESLEDRLVMSHMAIAPAAMPAVHVAPAATSSVSVPISIAGLNLTGVTTNVSNLITGLTGTVTGTIAGQNFTAPLTITSVATSPTAVPILDLHLGPIDLNILGLQVKTSEICLKISAQPGPGNLLGNLVGGLANALNGTLAATNVTGVTGLLGGLNGLIGGITGTAGTATTSSGALSSLTSLLSTVPTDAITGATGAGSVLGALDSALTTALGQLTALPTTGATNLVHLSVGPLHLNLLGLIVDLDNCAGGPVTVDVNAIPGSGNLLGNLLGGLAHILDTPSNHLGLLGRLDTAIIGAISHLHV